MKTVILSFYKVYPPQCGAASVTYNILKCVFGVKHLIQLNDSYSCRELNESRNVIDIKCIIHNPILKVISLFIQFPKIIKKIKELLPEVVLFEGASWSFYYLIFFYFMKAKGIKSKIIYHAHNVEYLLRRQKNNWIIAMVTKWTESSILKKVDATFAVSEVDADCFRKIYGIKPQILSNGVDMEIFEKITDDQIDRVRWRYNLNGKVVLFMGLPEFRPNKEAIYFLIHDVFPFIVKDFPEAKLAIIGGKIEYERTWIINPGNIPFEDVPAFIKSCSICVAPIFSGSGTRLKVIEYMAAGKPIVSTTKGIEGILARDRENIIIADNASHFIEKILFLMRNPKIADKVSDEGLKTVKEYYSWRTIMRDFNKILLGYENECPSLDY
jgi:glycosyltransferase involved in cell wall biosynthesis